MRFNTPYSQPNACITLYCSHTGMGDTNDQNKPTYVDALRGVSVQQIACGSGHTVVLTTEGSVYTWGRGGELCRGRDALAVCVLYMFFNERTSL